MIQCMKHNNLPNMSMLLRISLAALFITISIMVYMNPVYCREYVNERYNEFRIYLSTLSSYFSSSKVSLVEVPIWLFQVLSGFLFIGGILILLNIKKAIIFYAYTVTILGIFLSIPCTKKNTFKQSKHLLLVFLVFFCMIILSTIPKRTQEITKAKTS